MVFRQYLKHLSTSLLFYLILGFSFFIYIAITGNLNLISGGNFLHFDAILYFQIKNNGYNQEWLCAFFPAFPFFWKLLDLSTIGISILNGLIFILSFSLITLTYNMDRKKHFFFQSIPSLIFMLVPYTESLFFLAGTILIVGLEKDKLKFIITGLILGSLIRPTTFVFIPAILCTYFFVTFNLHNALRKSIMPVLALLFGLFVTVSIHYYFTNKWLVFFEAQKLWKNHLHLPKLPLTSWGGDGSLRFDSSALAISLFCGYYIFILFLRRIKKQVNESKSFIFSMLYIFGTALLILAYRDGNLYSLNRFIYATPFIIVFLHYFLSNYKFKLKHIFYTIIITELFWLLFNSYNHIHNLLMFSMVSLYFAILLLTKHANKTISSIAIYSLIIINCIGFIKLFTRYLNDQWVG